MQKKSQSRLLTAKITLFDVDTIGFSPNFKGLREGHGVSVFFEEVYYPARICELDKVIAPSEEGVGKIFVIGIDNLISVGDECLLKSGPTKIAIAKITEVTIPT